MAMYLKEDNDYPLDNLAESANNAGYKLSTSDGVNISLEAVEDKNRMPTIKVETRNDGSTVYYVPTITFPTFTLEEDMYPDEFHYWMQKWEVVGRFITKLCEFTWEPM